MIRFITFLVIWCSNIISAQIQPQGTPHPCVPAHSLKLQHRTKEVHIKAHDWHSASNERMPAVKAYSTVYSNCGQPQQLFQSEREPLRARYSIQHTLPL